MSTDFFGQLRTVPQDLAVTTVGARFVCSGLSLIACYSRSEGWRKLHCTCETVKTLTWLARKRRAPSRKVRMDPRSDSGRSLLSRTCCCHTVIQRTRLFWAIRKESVFSGIPDISRYSCKKKGEDLDLWTVAFQDCIYMRGKMEVAIFYIRPEGALRTNRSPFGFFCYRLFAQAGPYPIFLHCDRNCIFVQTVDVAYDLNWQKILEKLQRSFRSNDIVPCMPGKRHGCRSRGFFQIVYLSG